MSKKTNIVSLSLEPEVQQQLKSFAKHRTKGNVSRAVSELIEKHASLTGNSISVNLGPESQQKLMAYA